MAHDPIQAIWQRDFRSETAQQNRAPGLNSNLLDIDPLTALAISMEANKGVYALLLGSGVSRASGVPTGWDIVVDLIRKVAQAQNDDCEPDPAGWYRETFHKEPSYSDLIESVEPSPAARTQLLREYFEPSDDEPDIERKRPATAHRAIAKLAAGGYIRVIVTTNFDRLLQDALAAECIQPIVIATSAAAAGAIPLVHTKLVLIKINGDYLDPRFRNTHSELEEYGPALKKLLCQVLDQYGLIVCGWSAEWDVGLRRTLERCSSRRFTTYWTHFGKLGAVAKIVADQRNAEFIEISGADSFFKELSDKVFAVSDLRTPHPISVAVGIAQLKRYLTDERDRIRMNDLLHEETERSFGAIFNFGSSKPRLAARGRCREFKTQQR